MCVCVCGGGGTWGWVVVGGGTEEIRVMRKVERGASRMHALTLCCFPFRTLKNGTFSDAFHLFWLDWTEDYIRYVKG